VIGVLLDVAKYVDFSAQNDQPIVALVKWRNIKRKDTNTGHWEIAGCPIFFLCHFILMVFRLKL